MKARAARFGALVIGIAPIAALACGAPAPEAEAPASPTREETAAVLPAPDADTVAVFAGGRLDLADVAPHLRRAPERDPVDLYREAAEALAIERLLFAERPPAPAEELGADHERLRRQIVLDLYLRMNGPDPTEAGGDAEVAAHYERHRDSFERPAQRFVWHLFRRHRDPARPEETAAFLEDLRQRIADGGETFQALAREHSHSETRALDGRLGMIGRGRLPPALERVVFALGRGETSVPVPVPGGAALFHVSEVLEGRRFALEEARGAIVAELRQRRLDDWIAEQVAGQALPADARILDGVELAEASVSAPDGYTVLALGDDYRLSAAELRQLFERAARQAPPWSSGAERRERIYRRLVDRQRLYLAIRDGAWLDDPEVAERLERRLERAARPQVLTRRLEARTRRRAEADEEALRAFYDDNAHRFQSPLRLRMKTLSLPLDAAAPERMAALERAHRALVAGELDFAAAAARLGAEVDDQGWVDFEALMGAEPKLRIYLLQLQGPGYTVPFQLNNRLNLIWVLARDEPEVLPYPEVEERVLEAYLERHGATLRRAVVDTILAEHGFRFQPETVRRALRPAAEDEPVARRAPERRPDDRAAEAPTPEDPPAGDG